jgi:radical SAM protein with 4Fe4S-binding SPASM domain
MASKKLSTMNELFYEIKNIFSSRNRKEHFLERSIIRHFRRQGHVSPYTPLSIQVQTHSTCNGHCVYCPYHETSSNLPQGVMDELLFKKIIDEISGWAGLKKIALMLQNEPLLDANFFEHILYIKSMNLDIVLETVTNGTLLNPSMVDRICASGLDELTISMDAISKRTYELLHPGFSFEKMREGIRRLFQHKPDHLSIKFSFVLTKMNYHELEGFIQFVKNNGAKWRTIYLFNRANNVPAFLQMRLSSFKWHTIKNKLLYKYFYQVCPSPFARMNVLFNGDVIICCQDWQRKTVVGNANTQSLQEIWRGKRYNELRKKITQKRYHEISTCCGCSIAQFTL